MDGLSLSKLRFTKSQNRKVHRITEQPILEGTLKDLLVQSSEPLSGFQRGSSPFVYADFLLDFLHYVQISLVLVGPEPDPILQVWSHQC